MTWPVRIDPVFGCHLWQGQLDRDGYGRHQGKLAHRVVWESERGAIPKDKELDHVCRRRHCVRLSHLELTTRSEQERAKSWRYRARRVRCPKGHDLSDAAVTREGGRLCRRCML